MGFFKELEHFMKPEVRKTPKLPVCVELRQTRAVDEEPRHILLLSVLLRDRQKEGVRGQEQGVGRQRERKRERVLSRLHASGNRWQVPILTTLSLRTEPQSRVRSSTCGATQEPQVI